MTVLCDQRDRTLVLTIDRPRAKNAIDRDVVDSLLRALEEAATNTSVHSVVLAATGDVFLSGGDLKQLAALPTDESGAATVLAYGPALATIERCPLPVIAAVHGDVLGGGCELLLMCDLIIMEEQAGMRFAHVKMGLCPAWGASTRLLERIGRPRAADLLLSGRRIDAAEAKTWGLVTEVCPSNCANSVAMAHADRFAQSPREVLCRMKRSLSAAEAARRNDGFAREAEVFSEAWGKEPHQAAMAAFRTRDRQD